LLIAGLYLESELQAECRRRHGLGEVRMAWACWVALDLRHPIAASIVTQAFDDARAAQRATGPDTPAFHARAQRHQGAKSPG